MFFKNKDKDKLKKDLFNIIMTINDVISVTLVGSFWKKDNLKDFSDIDIVIIMKEIDKKKYHACLNKINKIDLKRYNLGHLDLLINPTFGPLKFDNRNNIVFHTMIYDLNSHIAHVIKSPFTCYDWERSLDYVGQSLKKIFPVGKIQLADFFLSRRGINDYIKNLTNNYIFYQKYELKINFLALENKKYKIDKRHKIEFAYHLCKFLIINFYKFDKQKNKIPEDNEIKSIIKKVFNKDYDYYLRNFILLKRLKDKKIISNKNFSLQFTKKFIKNFENYLTNYKKKEIIFLRHGKTKLNDGTFLGINRNPGIINNKKILSDLKFLKNKKIKILFSSSLRRACETAKLIIKKDAFIVSDLLMEKNYGQAEGLNYQHLKKRYPKIIEEWNKKNDPRFPSGENDADVIKRINLFKKKLIKTININKKKGMIIVISHNALLRCLIGDFFNTPRHMWVKINIDHNKPINCILRGNKFLPNLDRNSFFKNLII